MTYTIEKITTLIDACRYGNTEAHIAFLLTDSRSLCFPEETLFFALKTERHDGHHYIPELYRRGVRNFVVTDVPEDYATHYAEANFLQVTDTCKALQRLAECHRNEYHIPIVGITGSNGKTVVKEWLYQLLSADRYVTRSPRSYNSQIGVPLSVWLMNEQTEVGIFEAGISLRGEMRALREIIQPTIAVLTNIGSAHQENFASREDKCREKMVFRDAETIVYDADDELVRRLVAEMAHKGEALYSSLTDRHAPMFVTHISKGDTETTLSYIYKQGKEERFTIPFIDDASIANSITCAMVALHLGVTPAQLAQRMRQLEPCAWR